MEILQKKDINFNNLFWYECPANSESNLFYDDDYMYKMFKEENRAYLIRKKLKLEMLSDGGPMDNAVLANAMIMEYRMLSGYRMDKIVDGLPIFEFCTKSKNINDFLRLMYNVSLSLRNIHDDPRNIVIGDVSISNILFDKDMKHYFVDFDSVMVDKLPADRVPFALERYAKKCGLERYDINRSTDRLCLMLAFFFVVFRRSIEKVSMMEYDEAAEKVETLRNMREIVVEIKKYRTFLPDLPYLDEMVSSDVFQNKKRVKGVVRK